MQRRNGDFLTASVTNRWCNRLMARKTPLAVGATAPLFELRRTFQESIALTDLLEKGPVAVVFYVFDFGDI